MYKQQSVAAVVPAYNEETQINMVIDTMPDYVDKIVIIDDCSPDKTSEAVQEAMTKNDKVVLIRHEVNQGVGGAIATGYKWSRDNDIDIAVVMAGDGQMSPSDLPAILDPVADGEADYSKANRLISERASKDIPKIRLIGNSILSLLTKIASGYWHIADSQAGYAAISKQALHELDWDAMYKRYGQPNDLLVRLNVHDFRVRDVKTHPVYGVGEQSKLKVRKVVFTISTLLLKKFLWRMKLKYIILDFHPLVFFYFFGFMMFLLGTFFLGRLSYLWYLSGTAPLLSTLAMLFCFMFGFQSTFFAMWFDMEQNKHLR